MTITKVITDDGLAKVTQLAKSTFIAKTDTLEANEVELATVATSGSFADLSNKPVVDQVYDNTSANAQSGVAVKSAIDAAISSVYKPGGSIIFENLPNISSSILGYVYNISEAFTTTSDFVEGSGRTYPAGTNIVLVDLGNDTLKWDVLSGLVDLSGYQLANTAVTHTASTAVGSANQPVYIGSDGVAVAGNSIEVDGTTVDRNGSSQLRAVAVSNKNDGDALPIWEGTSQAWTNGETTPWYYWETDVTAMWTSGGSLPSSANWYSVTYGDGKFVAVAYGSNQAAYSTDDGQTWNTSTILGYSAWRSLTYGNGTFVTVAYTSNKVAYSTDGINWTESILPSSDAWTSVTYGNGVFVIVANSSDNAAYSIDNGQTWTASTLPRSTYWKGIAYGNGTFVVVAEGSNQAAYSTNDGQTWTESILPSSVAWTSVTYGNGVFVIVADGSDQAAYSTDGINWTTSTLPSSANWYSVTYGDDKFVAVASYSNQAAYSTDGINWTSSTLPSSPEWRSVIYGDGKFVTVAQDSDATAIFTMSYDKCYTLDQIPTTSTQVYSAPETLSAKTITSTGEGTITLSDNLTYNYTPGGNQSTYRTIGAAHPSWLCNIEGVGVKKGDTLIASKIILDTTPTQNSSNGITSGAVYSALGDIETLINAL